MSPCMCKGVCVYVTGSLCVNACLCVRECVSREWVVRMRPTLWVFVHA